MKMDSRLFRPACLASLICASSISFGFAEAVSPTMKPRTFAEHLENARRHAGRGFDGFDKNNDGQLSFDEFLEKTWRLYNTYTDAGANVTEQDFVQCFLGPADDPISGPAVSSARAEPYRKLFQTMDHGGKGYIVKNDVVQHARREFGSLDKSHDGFISMNELNGK